MRAIKFLLFGIAALIVLAAAALGAAMAVVDGQFVKTRLEAAMKAKNRTLKIEGVPQVKLFPVAGLALGKTSLSEPGGDKPFLSFDSAEVAVPAGHGRVGFVAASSVAAVAAQVLTSPGHEGATYVLTGPEALRFKDVAARISAVFARQVDYTDQPAERAREQMLANGVSAWQTDGNLELFDWIRQGGADTVTAAVREVTGADPSPVQDWLEDSRADFEVPPLDLPRSFF